MPEDISEKFSLQTSENVQKLFDLTTRLDERVKLLYIKEEQIDNGIKDLFDKNLELIEKIAGLDANQSKINDGLIKISDLERRISKIEDQHGVHSERWKNIANFFIQLIWVILAAYLLTQLNLQSPNIP